jgi:hypothetical protein
MVVDLSAYHSGARIDFNHPRKPTGNPYIAILNGTLRTNFFDTHWFGTRAKAKEKTGT